MSNKPFVFSFLSTKGGVGKSTVTFNLACFFAKYLNKKVVIAETDSQQPLKTMRDNLVDNGADFPEVIYVGNCSTAAEMKSMFEQTQAEFIFLDGIGYVNAAFTQSVMVSDFIVWMAGRSFNDLVPIPQNTEMGIALNKRGAYLMNGVKRNESVYELCRDQLRNSKEYNHYPLLESDLRDLSAYKSAYVLGKSIVDMDSSAKNAKEDLEVVAAEIFDLALSEIN